MSLAHYSINFQTRKARFDAWVTRNGIVLGFAASLLVWGAIITAISLLF